MPSSQREQRYLKATGMPWRKGGPRAGGWWVGYTAGCEEGVGFGSAVRVIPAPIPQEPGPLSCPAEVPGFTSPTPSGSEVR